MGWMMLDVYPNGGCLTGMVIIGYHHVLIGFDGTIPGIEDLWVQSWWPDSIPRMRHIWSSQKACWILGVFEVFGAVLPCDRSMTERLCWWVELSPIPKMVHLVHFWSAMATISLTMPWAHWREMCCTGIRTWRFSFRLIVLLNLLMEVDGRSQWMLAIWLLSLQVSHITRTWEAPWGVSSPSFQVDRQMGSLLPVTTLWPNMTLGHCIWIWGRAGWKSIGFTWSVVNKLSWTRLRRWQWWLVALCVAERLCKPWTLYSNPLFSPQPQIVWFCLSNPLSLMIWTFELLQFAEVGTKTPKA